MFRSVQGRRKKVLSFSVAVLFRIISSIKMSLDTATPSSEGFFMPSEWSFHDKTWLIYPHRRDIWRIDEENTLVVYKAFNEVIRSISRFEQVAVLVNEVTKPIAVTALSDISNIEFIDVDSDDCWIRDSGPTFLLHQQEGKLAGINWMFNSWGLTGMVDGVNYTPFEKDNVVAATVIGLSGDARIFSAPLVMEGGSFHVDGEGTVVTTEECLLNPNRNPLLTKVDIEEYLKEYLGAGKVIWLPKGLTGDEDTNGHVDNFCCFARPGEVILAWCDDPSDPQYEISRQALQILLDSVDAKGRRLKITKLPIPPPLYYTEEECAGLAKWGDLCPRAPGQRLAASYVNFYICNGGIICPSFGAATDADAVAILQSVFPEHTVVQVPGREILLGGGNIHCITQQQPALSHK